MAERSTAQAAESDGPEADADAPTLPSLAVWVASGLTAVAGLVLALGSSLPFGAADRAAVAEMVRSGQVQTEGLTEAQAVDLVVAMAWWGGVAMLALGLVLLLAGVGFALYCRRRTGEADGPPATTWTLATLGAFVTILASFLPVSPLFGGGVAGYLGGGSTGRGAKLGAISGVLAAGPLALALALFGLGLVLGLPDTLLVDARAIVAVSMAFAVLVTVVVTVGLSALGGVVGVYLGAD